MLINIGVSTTITETDLQNAIREYLAILAELAKTDRAASEIIQIRFNSLNGESWFVEPQLKDNSITSIELLQKRIDNDFESILHNRDIIFIQDRGIRKNGKVVGMDSLQLELGLSRVFNVRRVESGDKIAVGDKSIDQWIFDNTAVKEVLSYPEDEDRYIDNWVFTANKSGGANYPGTEGGIYKRGEFVSLMKQESKSRGGKIIIDHASNISEFLASQIFNKVAPGYGAKVFLAASSQSTKLPDNTGNNIYVGSLFFQNYSDLYIDAYRSMGLKVPSTRPKMVGTVNKAKFHAAFARANYKYYSGFPQCMVTSLLIGDFDTHWGNVGVIRERENGLESRKLVRIDFAWAFKNLSMEIRPHSIIRHMPGLGPTNHFREYPRKIKLTPEFAAELKRVAACDLSNVLEEALSEIQKYYGIRPMREFGVAAGIKPALLNSNDVSEVAEVIKFHLDEMLQTRQKGLRHFAAEIELELCWDNKQRKFTQYIRSDGSVVSIEDVISSYPEYFKNIIDGKTALHFRGAKQDPESIISKLDIFGLYRRYNQYIAFQELYSFRQYIDKCCVEPNMDKIIYHNNLSKESSKSIKRDSVSIKTSVHMKNGSSFVEIVTDNRGKKQEITRL